ncbi:MAG: hypothetical protein ABSF55_01290 [Candidatus Staskawiczbacteria bacterium]
MKEQSVIIRMSRDAGRRKAKHNVSVFERYGITVFVKNGDGFFTLAAPGEKARHIYYDNVRELAGVAMMSEDDTLFFDNRGAFAPAEEYFGD